MKFVFAAKIVITYFQRVSGYLQYIYLFLNYNISECPGKQPLAEGGYAVEIEQK